MVHLLLLLLVSLLFTTVAFISSLHLQNSSVDDSSSAKVNILVEGWTKVPHSFAIVNCFQLIGLLTKYGDDINLYLRETEYYYAKWQSINYSTFGTRHQELLESIPVWNGEPVDVVYRIHFPLDIRSESRFSNLSVPMIVFYVATRSIFTYSEMIGSEDYTVSDPSKLGEQWDTQEGRSIIQALPTSMYFVTPSPGSSHAMRILMTESQFSQTHRIIPHGVDSSIFYPKRNRTMRALTRYHYGVEEDEMVFLHVGAMVAAKGLDIMIIALFWLSQNIHIFGSFKLILKGLDDIYDSAEMLLSKMNSFIEMEYFTKEDVKKLIHDHIRFTSQTLSFDELNDLYNAADAYWSPYAYEGFNLPVLEAIATGLPVFISKNGSTAFFVDDIVKHVPGAAEHIIRIPEESYVFMTSMYYSVHPAPMINTVTQHWNNILRLRRKNKYYIYSLQAYLKEHYSWNEVARQLRAMIREVIGR